MCIFVMYILTNDLYFFPFPVTVLYGVWVELNLQFCS